MAKCKKCGGSGELDVRLPEKDRNGKKTGHTIPTTVTCNTCSGSGQV